MGSDPQPFVGMTSWSTLSRVIRGVHEWKKGAERKGDRMRLVIVALEGLVSVFVASSRAKEEAGFPSVHEEDDDVES